VRRPEPGAVWGIALGAVLPAAFVSVFFLLPLIGMLGLGFWPDGRLDLSGVGEVLARERTLRIAGMTLALAGSATAVCLVVGLPLAAVLHRRRFPGRGMLRALVTLPFVMPTVVVGLAFRGLLREGGPLGALGLDGTAVAVVLALIYFNIAVVARTVGTAWESLDPRMEEAARVLGAGPVAVFRTVTLPRLAPALASAAAIVFLFCATSFGVVLVLGGVRVSTIETEIYVQTMQFLDLRTASVLSVLQLVIVVALLVAAGRARRRRGPERRSGVAHAVRPATRHDAPGIAFAVIVAALLTVPLATLVVRSLRTAEGWGLGNYLALAGSGGPALRVSVLEALGNSLLLGLGGTALALAVGLPTSLVLTRRLRSPAARRALRALDAVLMLPLGVSAVTIGLGILITLDTPPLDLRSSPLLVPVAQALVALPLVVRVLVPVLDGIDPRQREALRVLGAPPWRVLRDVDLATAARPVLAAAALAFAVCLGEFGATAFLSRPEQATLPVVIYRLVGLPGADSLGMALAASVLLAALTVGVMAIVERGRLGRTAAF